MNDWEFTDKLRRITAAISLARASHITRSDSLRRVDEAANARLQAAEQTVADKRQWADKQLKEVTTVADQGSRLLPGKLEPIDEPPPPASLTAAPAAGLEGAVDKAQTQVGEIRAWSQKLEGWRKRRSTIIKALLILLLIVIAFGLLWLRRMNHDSAEQSTVMQTVVALAVASTQTAVPLMPAQELMATEEAPPPGQSDGTTTSDRAIGENNSIEVTLPSTLTRAPSTRTPRPPPTSGPTPTSLPPGAIVCSGASPTRLTVGRRARVINYQLNVRAGPGTHHKVVRRLDPGRTVDVLDGPVCDDGQLWYYILSEEIVPRDGSSPYRAEGWLVEESGDTYFLEPLQ